MEKLKQIAEYFQRLGITLYFVGGAVRDSIMGLPVEDIDICIVGGKTAFKIQFHLEMLLKESNGVRIEDNPIDNVTSVHGDFPIWIVEIDGVKYEFAMARTERKTGQSHQDFLTEVKDVTIEQDLYRRDLTINAMAENILTGEIVDPYGGMVDIAERFASPVSEAFMEDNLRVIRAARFIARFNLTPSQKLIEMCEKMNKDSISNERIGIELMKVMKQCEKPSKFFTVLQRMKWLSPWFKEVEDLIGVPQSPIHHPEGDVWNHTMHCIDAVPQGDWFMRTVMLCHDLGKVTTTTVNGVDWYQGISMDWLKGEYDEIPMKYSEWKVQALGHEEAGVEPTRKMLQRISFTDHKTIRKICCLVELHMLRATINGSNYDKMVRRTLRKLMHYELKYNDLVRVIHYDLCGRPPLYAPTYNNVMMDTYENYAFFISVRGEMEPIVTGEKLLALGLQEGPEIGKIVKKGLELQDRGTLKEHNWLKILKDLFPSLKQFYKNGKEI